jgi:hypothetical protein
MKLERHARRNARAHEVPSSPRNLNFRFRVKWQSALNRLVPMGYEDGGGFHYGEALASTSVGRR